MLEIKFTGNSNMNQYEKMKAALTEILNIAQVVAGDSDMSAAKITPEWLIKVCKNALSEEGDGNVSV